MRLINPLLIRGTFPPETPPCRKGSAVIHFFFFRFQHIISLIGRQIEAAAELFTLHGNIFCVFGSLWGLRGEKKEEMDLTPLLTLSRMFFFLGFFFFTSVGSGGAIRSRKPHQTPLTAHVFLVKQKD